LALPPDQDDLAPWGLGESSRRSITHERDLAWYQAAFMGEISQAPVPDKIGLLF